MVVIIKLVLLKLTVMDPIHCNHANGCLNVRNPVHPEELQPLRPVHVRTGVRFYGLGLTST